MKIEFNDITWSNNENTKQIYIYIYIYSIRLETNMNKIFYVLIRWKDGEINIILYVLIKSKRDKHNLSYAQIDVKISFNKSNQIK
jgi:hypothetical protein